MWRVSTTVPAVLPVATSPRTSDADALLAEYGLPDLAPVEQLRAVTRVAATVAGVPNAVVNLLSDCFQHQVGAVGFDGSRSDISDSMCAVASREQRLRHLPDARLEPAFADNPWVDGRLASVALYASTPLLLDDGRVLGSLCVFDERPGELSPAQLGALADLAAQAVALFEQARLAREAAQQGVELREARDQALAATRAKTAFLAAASHEIRTPLNGVLGMLDVLALGSLNGRQRQQVDVARRSGESLLQLLNDVLDLTKAETTAVVLASRPFRPVDVVNEVIEALHPLSLRKGIHLAATGASDDVLVGDPARLRQVVMNLTGNAVKFTGEGSVEIGIATAAAPGGPGWRTLRLSVTDTGAGMSDDEQRALFQPFTQGAQGARHGGTGLGLALSRQLVEVMGGRIEVSSRPGAGSTFTVVLELPSQASPDALPVPAPRAAPEDVVERPGLSGRTPLRVLVADDNDVNLMVARALLAAEGADVVAVEDGDEALLAVQEESFDLVLLDLQMVRMSGLEAARAIRALPGAAGATRLLALTADAAPGTAAACRDAGMQGVLHKPLRRRDLRQLLEDCAPVPA